LDWNNPGRVDKEVIELTNNGQNMQKVENDNQITDEKPMEESLVEASTSEIDKKYIFLLVLISQCNKTNSIE
jgi:hypothetical protein